MPQISQSSPICVSKILKLFEYLYQGAALVRSILHIRSIRPQKCSRCPKMYLKLQEIFRVHYDHMTSKVYQMFKKFISCPLKFSQMCLKGCKSWRICTGAQPRSEVSSTSRTRTSRPSTSRQWALRSASPPYASCLDPPPPRKPTQPKMFHTVKVFWYKFQDLGVGGAWAGQGGVKKIGLSKLSHLVIGCYVPTLSLFKFH